MSRYILALVMIGVSASAAAEIREFPSFSIDVPADWSYEIEDQSTGADLMGELISIYPTDGLAVLKMTSIAIPNTVSRERLRNFTNVDSSINLEWQRWGDFSGYQYSYVEQNSFFMQWWLSAEGTIVLVTYENSSDEQQAEIDAIEEMLISIRTNPA